MAAANSKVERHLTPLLARLLRALLCVLRVGCGLAVFSGLCGFAGLAADWGHNGNDDEQQEQQR